MAAVKVHLYRYRHPDGTAKDWAIPVAVASQGLTVYYGRTGSALRQADTPAGRCQDGFPVREGELRVREKLGKGYRSLGEFWLADNRRDLTPAGPSAAAPPSPTAAADTARARAEPPPCLYWRWRPGGTAEAASRRAAVEAACAAAAARLAAVGWTLPDSRPDDDGRSLWARLSGDACSGVLQRVGGNEPRLAFWLLVARRCVHLRLADDAQRPVDQWPAELPVAAEILETLGLKPKNMSQLLAACGGDEGWFF